MKKIMAVLISTVLAVSAAAAPLSVSAGNTTNPVIKGSYADPDIDVFGCKYWLYPTTDGNPGWSGTQFHAFSSENLTDWVDEGVILDVADENPGVNAKGVQIAASPWSCGNAWAPAIEEKGGKYYFYYCGRIKEELLETYGFKGTDGNYMGDKAIGVAVSDNPAGPYTALDSPLVYPKLVAENENLTKEYGGQIIDPSIFTDDGSSYILFGNGNAYMYKLGDDMMSVVDSSLRQLNLKNFRESVVLFKRGGIYHYTWSCDDTGSVNYHINYGTANSITASVFFRNTLIEKNPDEAIFGTGHQCTLYLPDADECYIAYGRHQTVNGVSVDDAGNFREVCITKLSFGTTGVYLEPVTPSNSAPAPLELHNWSGAKVVTKPTCKNTGVTEYTCSKCGEVKRVVTAKSSVHTPVTDKAVSPTFEKTGLTAGSHCKVCGKIITKQKVVAKLVPSATALSGVTAKSKAFAVKWKKQTKNTTGYQVQYARNKSFKSSKTVTVKSNKTTSLTVKKLTAKKKYYVRIRTYKQVGKKKYYSSWSKAKTVTTKK